ncbi:MAG: DUF4091 domain-containing protein [Thermoguttaceae bacterium]|nr:DUF4091 domain-containing protein [Thermoguttaceae bacterium]
MKSRWLTFISFCALICAAPFTYGADPVEIASKLYRGGGGSWTRVVPLVVENTTDADYAEQIISIPISTEPGALPFISERAESIRVTDAEGVEYIFNVVRKDGTFIDKGVIDEPCLLTIPATVPANAKGTYYVFAGNDKAYPNPDRLNAFRKKATNLDFEDGSGSVPAGWTFDFSGNNGALEWTTESPGAGKKCVRCDVPSDAKPSWIAARQLNVAIEPGAKYRFGAKVRGQGVTGQVGWYLHFGDAATEMLSSPMLYVNKEGDFDWTTLSGEYAAPEKADRLSFGTVLYGTGTAWYDSVVLQKIDADGNFVDAATFTASSGVSVGAEQALPVRPSVYPSPSGPVAKFEPEKLDLQKNARYATIKIDAGPAEDERLVRLDLFSFERRWNRSFTTDDFDIIGLDGKRVSAQFYDGAAFFTVRLVPNASNFLVLVEKTDPVHKADAAQREKVLANQAFPGVLIEQPDVDNVVGVPAEADASSLELPSFLAERNILTDGDFENIDPETFKPLIPNPDDRAWTYDDPNETGVRYSIVDSGVDALGKKTLRVEVGDEASLRWRGWRRRVKVEPNQTYVVGYAIKANSQSGSYDLHMHWRAEDGSLTSGGFAALGKGVGGDADWALKTGSIRAGSDAELLELHLTSQARGTAEYDSVFVAPVDFAEPVDFYGGKRGAFQVPAVAKVFSDTTFAASEPTVTAKNPAVCALALDEEETLQLAFRVGRDATWRLDGPAPTLRGSTETQLDPPELFAVGNVLVDYPTSYYQERTPKTTRKFPTAAPSCDGWVGYWPDPLIPIETGAGASALDPAGAELWNDSQRLAYNGANGLLDMKKDETRAVWLRFKTTADTKPGVYDGKLVVVDQKGGGKKFELYYTVEVLNFIAPQTKIAAIYDARIYQDYFGEGSRTEKLRKVAEHLLNRKLSPDMPVASPAFTYDKETGEFSADWTDYDAQTSRFFELGGKAAYFPRDFYLFGWGNPPKLIEGEAPYEGEYPYEGADRAQLRPEYKKVYQAKLKLFWDYLKEKGWADKFVLYISDEPFYSKPEIIAQMKALCDMIHEVDPEIPIYSSVWVFVPEWLGYIDVWGVGHYGGVGEEALQTIRDAGSRIWWTTDGQMCLDTPLCAVERLLPYTCVKHGSELYEFWGASWYTCDPFESASHLYIPQSDQPGVHYYVRYPNGDGYIVYPGDLVGRPGEILDSIRSEQAREGIEDAGWLVGLQNAIAEKTAEGSQERAEAQAILDRALDYLPLQCGSGRYSSRYISDPEEFEQIRLDVGKALEKLTNNAQ